MVYSYRVHRMFNIPSLMLVKAISQFIFEITKLRCRVHLESKCTIIDSSTHQIVANICLIHT